jgi:hypothetical protein
MAVAILVVYSFGSYAQSSSGGASSTGKVSGDNFSADDTISYINRQLATYPDTWFATCKPEVYTLSLSSNRRLIYINKTAYCHAVPVTWRYTVDALQLNVGVMDDGSGRSRPDSTGSATTSEFDHSAITVSGVGDHCVSCIALNTGNPCGEDFSMDVNLTAPEEITGRIGRAFRHLAVALQAEAQKSIPMGDPFAGPK